MLDKHVTSCVASPAPDLASEGKAIDFHCSHSSLWAVFSSCCFIPLDPVLRASFLSKLMAMGGGVPRSTSLRCTGQEWIPDLPWAAWDLRCWEWWLGLQLHEGHPSNRYNETEPPVSIFPKHLGIILTWALPSLHTGEGRTLLSESARLKFSTLRFFQLEVYNQTFVTSTLKQIPSLI